MDLQDYFFTSMNVAVMLKKTDSISKITEKNSIILGTKEDMPSLGKALSVPCHGAGKMGQVWAG